MLPGTYLVLDRILLPHHHGTTTTAVESRSASNCTTAARLLLLSITAARPAHLPLHSTRSGNATNRRLGLVLAALLLLAFPAFKSSRSNLHLSASYPVGCTVVHDVRRTERATPTQARQPVLRSYARVPCLPFRPAISFLFTPRLLGSVITTCSRPLGQGYPAGVGSTGVDHVCIPSLGLGACRLRRRHGDLHAPLSCLQQGQYCDPRRAWVPFSPSFDCFLLSPCPLSPLCCPPRPSEEFRTIQALCDCQLALTTYDRWVIDSYGRYLPRWCAQGF